MSTQPAARDRVLQILRRQRPDRVPYAPNYWQWFTHHFNHHRLPDELQLCENQLEMIRWLGLDVFSRNLYCDPTRHWFGGLAEEVWDGITVENVRRVDGRDVVTEITYHTPAGVLTERRRFLFNESTLVQEKHLLDDFPRQLDAFAYWVACRRWHFHRHRYAQIRDAVGESGLVIAGELCSPLKLLHLAAGAAGTVYLLQDYPERCAELLAIHENGQLDLVRQMLDAGVPAMISMDNLDAAFHTPAYIERCSARFYAQASQLCHTTGAVFFIHACGRQKAILPLISSLGVDGLEGVAFPPLGDVQLEEAFRLAGDRLIITGGISAAETESFKTRDEVFRYVEGLLARLHPWASRFMLSASCNTSILTPWEVIRWFRDAWAEMGGL